MDHTIFFFGNGGGGRDRTDDLKLAKLPLSQLSYAPDNFQNIKKWWAWEDLNFRPHAYQACALTGLSYRPELIGPCPAQTEINPIWIGQIGKGYEDGGKSWRSKYCKGIDFKPF